MTAPSSRDPSELRQKGSFGLDLGGEASTARGATPWALGLGPWALGPHCLCPEILGAGQAPALC